MKATSGVLTYDDFASLQRVGNAVTETLRLKSAPIIVRATQQPLPIGNYTVCHSLPINEHTPHSRTRTRRTRTSQVPAGHFLCLSPLWSQRDERLYADPDAFKPDRWNVRTLHQLPWERCGSTADLRKRRRTSTRRGGTGSTLSPSGPASTAARASSSPTTYVVCHQFYEPSLHIN
jgi:hypothetical protein